MSEEKPRDKKSLSDPFAFHVKKAILHEVI